MKNVYFENGYAILSTLGMGNAITALLVIGVIGANKLSVIPLIVSVASACANGLIYYAFYTSYRVPNRIAASLIADIMWGVQGIGLNSYSCIILRNVLHAKRRKIYLTGFISFVTVIASIRVGIAVTRSLQIPHQNDNRLLRLTGHLHIGYFSGIALLESWSSYFLLSVFIRARHTSLLFNNFDNPGAGTWHYFIKSTEVRLATLALIGIGRATTYSFVNSLVSVQTVPGQVDRFFYCLENMFPVVMMIDLLATKLPAETHTPQSSQRNVTVDTNKEMRALAGLASVQSDGNRHPSFSLPPMLRPPRRTHQNHR